MRTHIASDWTSQNKRGRTVPDERFKFRTVLERKLFLEYVCLQNTKRCFVKPKKMILWPFKLEPVQNLCFMLKKVPQKLRFLLFFQSCQCLNATTYYD